MTLPVPGKHLLEILKTTLQNLEEIYSMHNNVCSSYKSSTVLIRRNVSSTRKIHVERKVRFIFSFIRKADDIYWCVQSFRLSFVGFLYFVV